MDLFSVVISDKAIMTRRRNAVTKSGKELENFSEEKEQNSRRQ